MNRSPPGTAACVSAENNDPAAAASPLKPSSVIRFQCRRGPGTHLACGRPAQTSQWNISVNLMALKTNYHLFILCSISGMRARLNGIMAHATVQVSLLFAAC